jgi:hypothetical protein
MKRLRLGRGPSEAATDFLRHLEDFQFFQTANAGFSVALVSSVDGSEQRYGDPAHARRSSVATVLYPDGIFSSRIVASCGCAESTNQRMELMPCLKALEWVREQQPWPDVTRVQIITDSTYVANGLA